MARTTKAGMPQRSVHLHPSSDLNQSWKDKKKKS